MPDQTNLEIPLPQFQNVANFKKLVDITTARGFLVHGGQSEPWFFEGFRYREGVPRIYGPPVAGSSLADLLSRPREEALSAVLRLVRALSVLSEANPAADLEISPSSLYFPEEGGVLFLPAEVFRKIRLMSTEEYKAAWSRINNPYAENDRQRFSHIIAVLSYRALTGVFPFEGRDPDELHALIRHHTVTPPRHIFPELKPEISTFLTGAFRNKRLPVTLSDWEQTLETWIRDGVSRELDAEEKIELEKETRHCASRNGRRYKTGVFWEKHGRTVLVTGVVFAAAVVVIVSMIAHYLQPRRTAGMTPLEVVQTYYRCLNTLNPELMQDCLQGGAAADEQDRVDIMYVTTRQNFYIAGTNDRFQADLWEKAGRPRVDPPRFIDGVAALTITQERGEPSPVFIADHERWLTEPDPNNTARAGAMLQKGFRTKERVTLSRDNQGWRILKLERLDQTPIYSSDRGYIPKDPAP